MAGPAHSPLQGVPAKHQVIAGPARGPGLLLSPREATVCTHVTSHTFVTHHIKQEAMRVGAGHKVRVSGTVLMATSVPTAGSLRPQALGRAKKCGAS